MRSRSAPTTSSCSSATSSIAGLDPAGVVRLVRELAASRDVVVVQGNHEEKLCRWFKREAESRVTGKANPMAPPGAGRLEEWQSLTDDERAWLGALPVVAEPAPGWLAVHGGFDGTPRHKQTPQKLQRCGGVVVGSGRMRSLGDGPDGRPANSVFWTERWREPLNVVYGHAVASLDAPRVDRNKRGAACWGIDTGCCFGGRLSALELESQAITQVPARAKYADLGSDHLE